MVAMFLCLLMPHLFLAYALSGALFYIPKRVAFLLIAADAALWCSVFIYVLSTISIVAMVFAGLVWLMLGVLLLIHTDDTVYEMHVFGNHYLTCSGGIKIPIIFGQIEYEGKPLDVIIKGKHLNQNFLLHKTHLSVRLLGKHGSFWVVELADKKSASYFENHSF